MCELSSPGLIMSGNLNMVSEGVSKVVCFLTKVAYSCKENRQAKIAGHIFSMTRIIQKY